MHFFIGVSSLRVGLVLAISVDVLMKVMLEGKIDWSCANVA